jgi:hypothetical protein
LPHKDLRQEDAVFRVRGGELGLAEQIGTPNEVDFFQVPVTESGLLTARTQAEAGSALASRLSLLGPDGQTLVQSDGASTDPSSPLISEHLEVGTYFFEVAALGAGTGGYTLTTEFVPATSPFDPLLVGYRPEALVTADFNGDGYQDIATRNRVSDDVSLMLGLGDGSFRPAIRIPVGHEPTGLAARDFNNDGHPDLCIGLKSGKVSILLGRGDGTFEQEKTVGTNFSSFFTGGDYNGDGILDIASTRSASSTDLSIRLGRGDGTFEQEVVLPLGLVPGAGLSVRSQSDFNGDGRSDFNGDGRLDLISTSFQAGKVSILLNNGDGTFQKPVLYDVGTGPLTPAVADVNGDGHLDVITTNRSSNDFSVLLGRGDGTFQDQMRTPLGTKVNSVVAADFDGDGNADLAIGDLNTTVTVLMGRGDGTFQERGQYTTGNENVGGPATADFNGDGHLDLATANLLSDDVSVLLGNGDGTFQTVQRWAVGTAPLGLLVGDFNGDGRPDLAAADNNSSDVALLLGRSDGTFDSAMRLAVKAYPIALATGDFNGDGRSDLAAATQLSADLSLFEGVGDGTFVPPGTTATAIHSVPLIADLNGHGAADVAVVNRDGQILFRRGRPGAPGSFTAPVVVNPDPDPAARDLAVVHTPGGLLLAALDARQSALSFYTLRSGTFTRIPGQRCRAPWQHSWSPATSTATAWMTWW